MSFPLVRYVLMAALRDKLILSMFVVLVLSSSLSLFLASSVITEKDQFTLVFTASSLRLVSVLGLVVFVTFFVRRSFDGKDIEFLLSRPISRLNIVFSYVFSFSIMAVCVSLALTLALYAVAPHLFGMGHVFWLLSIIVENIAMVTVAFFFAMQISSAATSVMATLGVYVLGRLMGQLLGIIDSALVDSSGIYAVTLQVVSVITPRLDLLGQSSWLLYGYEGNYFVFALFQVMFFIFLVISAAYLDFSRRQF